MTDVIVERVNASFIRVLTADDGIRADIEGYFSYPEPGFQRNKWTKWDGTVRLFKRRGNLLPYGCLMMLIELAKSYNWKIELDAAFRNDLSTVTKDQLIDWVKTLELQSDGIPIEPYDYQLEGLYQGVKYNRKTILAATSAGKSLIAYMLTRYYEMLSNEDGKKILILVPSVMLVEQMYKDFIDYSTKNGWSVKANVHQIMEGMAKNSSKMVYISTWQSIKDEDEEYFKQFGRIINDETHLSSGKCITHIMNSSTNAYQRVGMTGTLKAEKVHPILVMSLIGPIKRVVTTKQLIDAGRATAVDVKMLNLDYSEEQRLQAKGLNYQDEIAFLIENQNRNRIISTLAISLKGNTLLMVDRLVHIEAIELLLKTIKHNKTVYVITGEVGRDEREIIKSIANHEDDIIVIGTPGCVSTGLSIKKLRNIIFGHPSKSNIRVLQSVGRILRLHTEKGDAHVYDLVDDLSLNGKPNYALTHAMERYSIYKQDEFPLTTKTIKVS